MDLAFELLKEKDLREDNPLQPYKIMSLVDIFEFYNELEIVFNFAAFEGSLMDQINASVFVQTGGILGTFLARVRHTAYSYGDLALELNDVIAPLQRLCHISMPLSHTKEMVLRLMVFLQNLARENDSEEEKAKLLSPEDKDQIKQIVFRITDRLAADLSRSDLYFISEKRIYSPKGLIFNSEKMLPDRIVNEISEECKRDIQDAGRAIAFDLPTAAGFYISRALEIVILMYFPALGLNPLE